MDQNGAGFLRKSLIKNILAGLREFPTGIAGRWELGGAKGASSENNNAVFNLCCRLCSAYERKAFLDGLQYDAEPMLERERRLLDEGVSWKLKRHIADNPPNYGDADSALGLLYDCFNENNPYDNEQIKADFEELYRQMNGMPLREMDRIVYPGCKLCRDHERSGFVERIKIGIRLQRELTG